MTVTSTTAPPPVYTYASLEDNGAPSWGAASLSLSSNIVEHDSVSPSRSLLAEWRGLLLRRGLLALMCAVHGAVSNQ